MSAIVPAAGNIRQLDRPAEPEEQITPEQAQDPDRLARLLMRILRDLAVLRQVYDKGLAAWSSGGHRPGASQHAWAMARVESFVRGGPTALGPDRRLAVAAGIVREK